MCLGRCKKLFGLQQISTPRLSLEMCLGRRKFGLQQSYASIMRAAGSLQDDRETLTFAVAACDKIVGFACCRSPCIIRCTHAMLNAASACSYHDGVMCGMQGSSAARDPRLSVTHFFVWIFKSCMEASTKLASYMHQYGNMLQQVQYDAAGCVCT